MVGLPAATGGEPAVLALAERHRLALEGLSGYWHGTGQRPAGLIVGYGTPGDAAYPAALDTLARVLRAAGGLVGYSSRRPVGPTDRGTA